MIGSSTKIRVKVWKKHAGECFYCGRKTLDPLEKRRGSELCATIDHRIPRVRGGTESAANIVLSCLACNELKGDLTEEEFVAGVVWMVDKNIAPINKRGKGYRPIAGQLIQHGYFSGVAA